MDFSLPSFAELLPIALFIKNNEGVYQYANSAFLQHLHMLGYEENVIGKKDKDIFENKTSVMISQHDQRAFKINKKLIFDEKVTVKKGRTGNQLAVRSIIDMDGAPHLLTLLLDISALKSKEIELISAKQEAEASERANRISLNHVLQYLPGYVYWKNTDSVYLGCNENFAIAAGLSRMEDIVGKTDYDLAWGKTEADIFRQGDREAFSGRSKINFEEPQRMASGKQATVLATKVPLLDSEHKIIGVLGIYNDITDRKQAELALKEAKEKAEEAMAEKTQFIRNMSHDLRTPITGIIGMSNILSRQTKEPFTKNASHEIELASCSLLNFFNQMIETTELELGELPDFHHPFSLKNIHKNIIEIFTPAIRQKNLIIESYFDQSIPSIVIGNDAYFYRILLNLFANAIKFTEKGTLSIEMTLERHTLQDAVIQVSIKDTGIGIPKEKQTKIFEKFNRLTPSYENVYKGTGLGLYMVSQYLQRMGGEIYLESRPGTGSRFTFFVPFKLPLSEKFAKTKSVNYLTTEESAINYALSSVSPEVASTPALSTSSASSSSHACHVLLVEDNLLARKIGQFNLTQWGYTVTTAATGTEAETQLNTTRFDLVYLDLGLPDKNGIDVATAIKSNPSSLNYATPFIALTANTDEISKKSCAKAGFAEIVPKPLMEKDALRLRQCTQSASSELAVIDWALWQNRCHHHESLVDEAMRTALRDLPLFESQIETALQHNDMKAVRDILHTCLGMLRFCALPRLEKAVETLHDLARKDPEKVLSSFQDFQKESLAAISAIQSHNQQASS